MKQERLKVPGGSLGGCWLSFAEWGDSEKSRWEMLKNVLIRVSMGMSSSRVLLQLVQRAAACLKPQQPPNGSPHVKSLPENGMCRETENSLMCSLNSYSACAYVRPTSLSIPYQTQQLLPLSIA